jgi:putative intracellular protease/amidase
VRDTAYLLILEGFADWEASLAASEINKSGQYSVKAVGLSRQPVRSMGGLTVQPELAADEIDLQRAAVLLVPGGTAWEMGENEHVTRFLHRVSEADVPIAALCGATIGLARAGLLRGRKHTSNMRGYLADLVPGYAAETHYVDQPAVRDGNVITASGMGGVEFAYEVLQLLDIYSDADRETWLRIFRDKTVPNGVSSEVHVDSISPANHGA